jgi:hypothetical protein
LSLSSEYGLITVLSIAITGFVVHGR